MVHEEAVAFATASSRIVIATNVERNVRRLLLVDRSSISGGRESYTLLVRADSNRPIHSIAPAVGGGERPPHVVHIARVAAYVDTTVCIRANREHHVGVLLASSIRCFVVVDEVAWLHVSKSNRRNAAFAV